MSKSDVRIVTSKNGFEVLKSFVENYIKEISKRKRIQIFCKSILEERQLCF